MLGTLIKKQLKEFFSFQFGNSRKKAKNSKVNAVGFAALFIVIFVSLGFVLYFEFDLAGALFFASGLDWFYFALAALIAIFLGLVASIFMSYSSLFNAKDNELLLSMPIKPVYILSARMITIFIQAICYVSTVIIPALIVYCLKQGISALVIVCSIIMIVLLSLLVTCLSCAGGYVIALVSSKLKNKTYVTVAISIVCFAAYFYIVSDMEDMINAFVEKCVLYGQTIENAYHPIVITGSSFTGNFISLLIVMALVCVLTFITCVIMSKSFIQIITRKNGNDEKVFTKTSLKAQGSKSALIKKEFKRYLSNATYIMNCSIGSVFSILLLGAVILKGEMVGSFIEQYQIPVEYFYVVVLGVLLYCSCMNDLTAPSISLEGENLWILKTMPLSISDIFNAKKIFHYLLTMPFIVIDAIVMIVVFKMPLLIGALIIAISLAYIMFNAALGLFINLCRPNLHWNNEVEPIKQSMSVMFCILGGMIIVTLACGACFYFLSKFGIYVCLGVVLGLFVVLTLVLEVLIKTKGTKMFAELS